MQILLYILKRILQTIPLLIIVSIVSFFIIRLSPVDPLAELRLNPSVSKETLLRETERLGLDKPIIVQYGKWAKSFIKGDLGVTSNGEQVSATLKERIPNTLLLTVIVIFLTWVAGIPLGVAAALNWKTPFDRMMTVLTSIGKSYLINIRFMSVAYCLPGIVIVTPSLQSTASPFPPAFRATSSRR